MRYIKNNNFVLLVFILLNTQLIAQKFPSKNFSTKEGLSNNQVESILKDSRDILWIGTNNGLSKIVNGEITNLFKEDGLAHNSVWDLIEDKNGDLWIASYGGGLTKFDGKLFTVYDETSGLANNFIRKLYEFKEFVFIGTENGLSLINKDDNSISTIETDIEDFQVMDFFIYEDELYCCTFNKGIYNVDIENKSIIEVFDYNSRSFFSLFQNKNFIYYSFDNHSLDFKGSIRKFDIQKLVKNGEDELKFGKSIIWETVKDKRGKYYSAAWGVHTNNGGVFEIKTSTDSVINRSIDFGIKSTNIRCLFYDEDFDFLYVGSTDKGFYQVDLSEKINYIENLKVNVIDIENVNNELSFLTKLGFTIVDNETIIKQVPTKTFLNYGNSSLQNSSIEIQNNYGFLTLGRGAEGVIFYKILIHENFYWVSSNIGLFQLDFSGNFIKYYPISTYEFEFDKDNNLMCPIPYTDFNIVENLNNYYFNETERNSRRFNHTDPNIPTDVTSYVKLKNEIFISTRYKGLFRYRNGNFQGLKENNKLEEVEIEHLSYSESHDLMAIATTSGNVFLANVKGKFDVVNKIGRENIIGNSILFLESYEGIVFIGTEKGINIHQKDGKFQFLDVEQGLINLNFTSSKIIRDTLIIGTTSGYYKLNIKKLIGLEVNTDELNISKLLVNYEPYLSDSKTWFNLNEEKIELDYNQNTISIDFTTSNYAYPKKLLYSFQLEGLDTVWSPDSNKASIFHQYLPYGSFNVNVRIKDLISGETVTSSLIELKINSPFWKTWWFITLITLSTLGLILLILKRKLKQNKKRLAIEKEIAQLQIKTIKNQVDPHFVFNAINTISSMILSDEKLIADDFICKFSDLMRKTLNGSDKIAHTLKEELDYVETFIQLQQVRFNFSFDYEFNIDKLLNKETLVPKHVLYCYVENAIKHGISNNNNDGLIKIKAFEFEDGLKLIIENNGVGIENIKQKNKYSTGNGILIMEKIYNLYYKLYKKKITSNLVELKDENGFKKGFKVEVTLLN